MFNYSNLKLLTRNSQKLLLFQTFRTCDRSSQNSSLNIEVPFFTFEVVLYCSFFKEMLSNKTYYFNCTQRTTAALPVRDEEVVLEINSQLFGRKILSLNNAQYLSASVNGLSCIAIIFLWTHFPDYRELLFQMHIFTIELQIT